MAFVLAPARFTPTKTPFWMSSTSGTWSSLSLEDSFCATNLYSTTINEKSQIIVIPLLVLCNSRGTAMQLYWIFSLVDRLQLFLSFSLTSLSKHQPLASQKSLISLVLSNTHCSAEYLQFEISLILMSFKLSR
jgi:hypothetical protein